MRLPEVVKVTSLSRSTIYLKISKGQFPQGIKLSERTVAWKSTDIEKWMENPMGWSSESF